MRKQKKAIIFGTGSLSEVVSFLLDVDSDYDIVAYTSTKNTLSNGTFCGKPVLSFCTIEKELDPKDHDMFIAVGYGHMNLVRERFINEAKNKGYNLLSYVSSRASIWKEKTTIGENVFIFENNNIQPFTKIGNGVIMWSGNHLGHHSTIEDYSFITSHVVISGHCTIGSYSFLGVNSTVIDQVKIASKNLIGAHALIQKDTKPEDVYLSDRASLLKKKSDFFFRF